MESETVVFHEPKEEQSLMEDDDKKEEMPHGLLDDAPEIDNPEEPFTLVSIDEQRFTLPRKALVYSGMLRTSLSNDKECKELKLYHIGAKSYVLAAIVAFCNYHCTGPKPQEIEKPVIVMTKEELFTDPFDLKLMTDIIDDAPIIRTEAGEEVRDKVRIYELIEVANYLEMPSLMDMCAARIVLLVRGKTKDEIHACLFSCRYQKETKEIKEEKKA